MPPPSFSGSLHHWFNVATQDHSGYGPLRKAIPDYSMHNTTPLRFAFTVAQSTVTACLLCASVFLLLSPQQEDELQGSDYDMKVGSRERGASVLTLKENNGEKTLNL